MKPWLMVDVIFRMSELGAKQREADRIINQYARRVIRLKRDEIQRRRDKEVDAAESDGEEVAQDAAPDAVLTLFLWLIFSCHFGF